jgi:predicted N-acyltransferase
MNYCTQVFDGFREISPTDWQALQTGAAENPFVAIEWLAAMESSLAGPPVSGARCIWIGCGRCPALSEISQLW